MSTTRPRLDTVANLIRARETLDALVKAMTGPPRGYAGVAMSPDYEWARFYEALQFVPGMEDAATEQFVNAMHDMGLDSEGFADEADECSYVPMAAIYMAQVPA